MTVCIAAACEADNEKKIILCTDQKSSSALGSAETARKEIPLGHSWRCLTAGTEPDILALVRLYKKQFQDSKNLKADTIDASVKAPLHQRKKELAEEYVRRRFAFSHDEFVKFGKERLPAEIFYDANQRIDQLNLNASLILAGFIDGEPEIYYTESDGVARAANHFAIIGEGEYVAASALLRRQQDDWTSFENTLYHVWEAKKLSEAVGSVGRTTFMSVISKDGSRRLTSLELESQLESAYKKYGPQKVPKKLVFDGDYYYKRKTE